jgi:LacI family transcriptional regulator
MAHENFSMTMPEEARQRARITDVARAAGVSTATVDRVLNQRGGVKERTRIAVMSAASRIGYTEDLQGEIAAAAAPITLDFLLPGGSKTFMDLFAAHLRAAAAAFGNVACNVERFSGIDPFDLARLLRERVEAGARGIGIVPVDHPVVREAIRSVNAQSVPVLTLMSDISGSARFGYIGIDNRAAGRLAAYLLGRFLPREARRVALFTGSRSYRGHEEREAGFRTLIAEEFSHIDIVETREVRDDAERANGETRALIGTHPDLAGIYSIGGGLRGIGRAVQEAGASGRVTIIGHELTDRIRPYLIDGTIDAVIDQNPAIQAREAIDRLRRAVLGEDVRDRQPLRTQVFFRENLPDA